MTTIAWDGNTIAGDSRGVASELIRDVLKVFRVNKTTVVGCCGYHEDALAVVEWLKSDCKNEKPEISDNFSAILIMDKKVYKMEEKLFMSPIKENFHSIGSGSHLATMAMYLGRPATEAVKLAMLFDPNTGGNVTSIPLDCVSKIVAL